MKKKILHIFHDTHRQTLHFLFVPYVGLEPIYMQVSGGHLLAPVQKLGPTSILSFR